MAEKEQKIVELLFTIFFPLSIWFLARILFRQWIPLIKLTGNQHISLEKLGLFISPIYASFLRDLNPYHLPQHACTLAHVRARTHTHTHTHTRWNGKLQSKWSYYERRLVKFKFKGTCCILNHFWKTRRRLGERQEYAVTNVELNSNLVFRLSLFNCSKLWLPVFFQCRDMANE